MSAPPDRISELLHPMLSCMCDVKAWATASMLRLNDNKTELMLVTSNRTKHLHNLPSSITMGNAQIPVKQCVKNLGCTLDCHLTTNANFSNIARTCYVFMINFIDTSYNTLFSGTPAPIVSLVVSLRKKISLEQMHLQRRNRLLIINCLICLGWKLLQ